MLNFCLCGLSLTNLFKVYVAKRCIALSSQLALYAFGSMFLTILLSVSSVFAEEPFSESIKSRVSDERIFPLVIVNQSVENTHLSLKKLRTIFAMKFRYWDEDTAISVFVLPKGHPVHAEFCKKTLNIFPNQLESVWYRQVYTGTGQAPIEVQSESELLERIANTPGAIGYVNKNNENIKRFSDDIKIIQMP